MALFLALPLALLSMVLLAWPILRRGRPASGPISPLDPLEEVRRRQQQIYEEIQTLILDHELGNVRHEEYEEELRALRLKAAHALQEQDQLQQAMARLEEEMENEALELRKSWGTVRAVKRCASCGGEMDAKAVVCPRCALSPDRDLSTEEKAHD
ncbi:MAG: hypothetical protein HW388_245 [Dehalococcoidia bacterium]|nr:hypothetical protein [Dehalococcoidia bacterium]